MELLLSARGGEQVLGVYLTRRLPNHPIFLSISQFLKFFIPSFEPCLFFNLNIHFYFDLQNLHIFPEAVLKLYRVVVRRMFVLFHSFNCFCSHKVVSIKKFTFLLIRQMGSWIFRIFTAFCSGNMRELESSIHNCSEFFHHYPLVRYSLFYGIFLQRRKILQKKKKNPSRLFIRNLLRDGHCNFRSLYCCKNS